MLPADIYHRFNFFTMSIKLEYLKLISDIVPAHSNITRPIYLSHVIGIK